MNGLRNYRDAQSREQNDERFKRIEEMLQQLIAAQDLLKAQAPASEVTEKTEKLPKPPKE